MLSYFFTSIDDQIVKIMETVSLKSLPPEFFDEDDSDNVCFLCNKPKYRLVYDVKHFEFPFSFKECQCGLVKQTPMPNEKFFEWFFNSGAFFNAEETDNSEIWGYYDYFADESSRLSTSTWRYKKLKKYFEEKGSANVMKIGPATGTMLHVAKQKGHKVRGCDVSSRFAEYARSNYNVEIDNGRFEQMPYEDNQFDINLLFNVIENVPNQAEFLTAINRTMKTGGYFISNFVDMKNNLVEKFQKSHYFIYRPPICYTYTMEVYEEILKKYGFEIVEIQRDMRHMHLEKISTLLRWKWLLNLSKAIKVSRINFPLYAYPSRIVIARKIKNVV